MEIKQKLTPRNFTKGNNRKIEYLVIHYFGGLASAEAVANYFYNNDVLASAHYAVDEKDIYQMVKDEDISWHAGESTQGTFGNIATNNNSISIEIRPYKLKSLPPLSALDNDWYFDDKVITNALWLASRLMLKYNIPITKVIRHYDITKKYCPRPFVGDDVNKYYGTSGNVQWQVFKRKLEELTMKKEQIKEVVYEVLADMKRDPSVEAYSEGARLWGEQNGIMVGKAYKGLITREESIAILYRLYELIEKKFLS